MVTAHDAEERERIAQAIEKAADMGGGTDVVRIGIWRLAIAEAARIAREPSVT